MSKKRNDTPEQVQITLLKSRVNRLEEHRRNLQTELDMARVQRDQSQHERLELASKLAAHNETSDLVYTIERISKGGKPVGIKRTCYGIDAYTLLGLLTMAVDEVKQQITRDVPPPQRVYVEPKKNA
jgi:FtsZ-binding cell division protein ZapB